MLPVVVGDGPKFAEKGFLDGEDSVYDTLGADLVWRNSFDVHESVNVQNCQRSFGTFVSSHQIVYVDAACAVQRVREGFFIPQNLFDFWNQTRFELVF